MRFLFWIIAINTISISGNGQILNRLEKFTNKNLKLVPIPTIYRSPENGLALGLGLDYYYKVGKKDSSNLTRPSLSWVQALYSTRGHLILEGSTSTFLKNDSWFISSRTGYYLIDEKFWGFDVPFIENEKYITLQLEKFISNNRFNKKIASHQYIGIPIYIGSYRLLESNAMDSLASVLQPLNLNSFAQGAGISYTYDSRDNQFSPRKGIYLDVSYQYFLNTNNLPFSSAKIDYRLYHERRKHHISGQIQVINNSKHTPFFELARMGGGNMMRGMYAGRLKGTKLASAQVEYRYELHPLLKIAAFASTANTGYDWRDLSLDRQEGTAGIGLRGLLNKSKVVYVRLDMAVSTQGELNYYFRLNDAF